MDTARMHFIPAEFSQPTEGETWKTATDKIKILVKENNIFSAAVLQVPQPQSLQEIIRAQKELSKAITDIEYFCGMGPIIDRQILGETKITGPAKRSPSPSLPSRQQALFEIHQQLKRQMILLPDLALNFFKEN